MTKEYKVWVEVEEINLEAEEEEEQYVPDPLPEPAGVFTSEKEARALQTWLVGYAEGLEST